MIKAVPGGLPYGLSFCMSFLEFSSLIKHINMLLLNDNKIAGLDVPVATRSDVWPARTSVGRLSLGLRAPSQAGRRQTSVMWGGRACRLAGSSGLWAAGLIQGQTWLPSSLPFGDQPPGVCSNEQAAFSSYILVSPPFENKTLPHLLASGIAIIAWRIIGGNSIWGKPCWFEAQAQWTFVFHRFAKWSLCPSQLR